MNARALALLALGAGFACNGQKQLPYPLHVSVKADGRVPVPGAQISMQGQLLGTTNQAGEIDTQLPGAEGDRVSIKLTCPDGFAAKQADSTIVLRSGPGLGNEDRRPILHDLACQPLKRDAVIVVHASGAGASLPVKIDGAPVGRTDGLGYGHFHVRTDPGARFEVAIDTSANGTLLPQNPHEVFQIDEKDDLFVFEQRFKLAGKLKAAGAHQRTQPAAKPVTVAPVR
ncbi:MAG TPA: hypothetical protein VG963_29025 [Polyangiaceae bacterium]|nr:hypothetical protein [Polyangiaceae bacterium]